MSKYNKADRNVVYILALVFIAAVFMFIIAALYGFADVIHTWWR